jgi:hypothetical protein
MTRLPAGFLILAVIGACAGEAENEVPDAGVATDPTAGAPAAVASAGACEPVERMPVEGRASAFDSTLIDLGGAQAKLCYGRPSMNGRQIYGGLVPYDTLWRTGANEPTTLHLPVRAEIAGIEVEPGSYSIYTVPGRDEWSVIVNRSTSQWGIESAYTPEVRAQEIARAQVPSEQIASPAETFVITAEPTGPQGADLALDWETTRVRIPIRRI